MFLLCEISNQDDGELFFKTHKNKPTVKTLFIKGVFLFLKGIILNRKHVFEIV